MSDYVLCPACFEKAGRPGEKTCVHGLWSATCAGCRKRRAAYETPYWHCLGGPPKIETKET